jgi:hypothetical protein
VGEGWRIHAPPNPDHAAFVLGNRAAPCPLFAPSRDSIKLPPTHWADGALAGAVILGVEGLPGSPGRAFCSNLGCVVVSTVFPAVIGIVVGGLIGGLFPQ